MRARFGRRLATTAVAVAAISALFVALCSAPAAARGSNPPAPITHPGGLTPGEAPLGTPTCNEVCIVKDPSSAPSCTGYRSQTVPPAHIRVLVHRPNPHVVVVPFQQYLQNVLPDEWIASWDGAAIRAGAVAVKSYAWYWVNHYGGYLNSRSPSNCFDVTDDTNFQVYRAGSALERTNAAVQETWEVVAQQDGQVMQASYLRYLHSAGEACGAYANGTQLSQYGTQACAEDGYGYPKILRTYYSGVTLAATTAGPRQLRTPNAFTFHGRSSLATFDPSTGSWALGGRAGSPFHFGTSGDVPVVTNEGDGFARIGVFRPSNGTWYQADLSGATARTTQYGGRHDVPVQAHYNGVSKPTVLAVFRPANGNWYIHGRQALHYGTRSDIPVPGHYAGASANDYADQPAVFRPATGTWHIRDHSTVRYGSREDIPVPGDYNGDGTTDVAVFRPANQTWYVRGSVGVKYGAPGDIPVTGDFDGSGGFDIAVYRPSTRTWYVRGQTSRALGGPDVIPIGKAPYRD